MLRDLSLLDYLFFTPAITKPAQILIICVLALKLKIYKIWWIEDDLLAESPTQEAF